jgi:hypothetical protein
LSNRALKRYRKAVSTLESESPVDLYWLHRQEEGATQPIPDFQKKEGSTIICDAFWDDFIIVAKATKIRNQDATIYDAFNFIREHMMGGWSIIEDSPFTQKIDAEIEREYQKECKSHSLMI